MKQAVDHLGVYGAEDYDAFVMTVSVRSNYERLRLSPDATQKELIAAQRAVKEWLSVFGLTPQSRSTVSIKGKKPEDSAFKRIFDDLMN
ncbi:hypothetical protein [Anaeromyxobacter sp. PSR-1]|uniref:hypothetical protein n=1 Tax=Anaeromyxobacter sp. PSR-1 TaxID=1300915 RepID=UPI0007509314|nr:hypothetical protein [Anaeromyxobacter sp. PSR-1]